MKKPTFLAISFTFLMRVLSEFYTWLPSVLKSELVEGLDGSSVVGKKFGIASSIFTIVSSSSLSLKSLRRLILSIV